MELVQDNVTNVSSSDDFPYEEVFGPQRDSLYIVVPITIIYTIIFCTGLIGNVSTCIVIAKNKLMHTATNYYLFSLACSDLLLLVSGLPPEVYLIWKRYPYIFGYSFCVLRGLFAETSANATVLTITAFTAERYVAICHPFLSHTMSKLSRVIKLIVLIWIVSVACAIPQAFQFGIAPMYDGTDNVICHIVNPFIKYSFEISTLIFFVFPMTIISVLYAMIGLQLRASTKMKRDPVDSSCNLRNRARDSNSGKHQQGKSSQRVIKMLVAVVVAFFICWAPFHAQRLVAIYVDFSNSEKREFYLKIYEVVTYTSGILYFFSTTINPLLYNIMSNKFREAFKETISKYCCKCACFKSEEPKGFYTVFSRTTHRMPSGSSKDDASLQTNSTLIHKYSEDSIVFIPSGRRCCENKELGKMSSCQRKPIVRSRCEICVASDKAQSNLAIIRPNTKLVTVKVSKPPPGKFVQLLKTLKCIDVSSESIPSNSDCSEIGGKFSKYCTSQEFSPKELAEDEFTVYSGKVKAREAPI